MDTWYLQILSWLEYSNPFMPRSGWPGFYFQQGQGFFSLPPHPDQLWGPPSLLFNEYQGLFLWGVKQPGHEADHSTLSSAKVKNACSYTSTPPYIMVWCLVKHRDNFTFTSPY
jgi:hypothetical protein